MRCFSLATILFALVASLASAAEPAAGTEKKPSAPAVVPERARFVEIPGAGPVDQIVQLKAALAHLEKAGLEDPEIAKAARILRELIDANKKPVSVPAVEMKLLIVEASRDKLREAGVDWQKLTGDDRNAAAEAMDDLVERELVDVLSRPQIQTLSGRPATLEVGNEADKIKAEFLPTVLMGNKVNVRVSCDLSRTHQGKVEIKGVRTELDIDANKPVLLGTQSGDGKHLFFVMTATIMPEHSAKASAKSSTPSLVPIRR